MRYLLLFIFLLSTFPLLSQDYLTSVRHYDAKDGLNTPDIRFGFKDSQGFLWFTSKSGAFRFDGYQFKSYQRRLDRDEPFDMNELGEDADRNIWIFHYVDKNTGGDISILPFGKDSLISFDHFFKNKTPFPAKNIYKIFFNDKNIIHILTNDGEIFEYANQSFIKIFQVPNNLATLYHSNVLKTHDNYHYISYKKERLKISPDYVLEKRDTIPYLDVLDASKAFEHLRTSSFLFLQYELTPKLEELFNREDELNLIPPNSNSNSNYILNNKNDDSYDLELINLENNITIDIEPFGIPNTIIAPRSFFVENENSIWLTTHDGIYHIRLIKKRFTNFLPGYNTRQIIRDENRNAWITSDQGLHKINLTNKNTQTKTGKKWKIGRGLFLENNNTLWVSKLFGVIQKVNPSQFEIQKEYLPYPNQKPRKNFHFIKEDQRTKQLWVGSTSGLLKYDPLSDDFLNFEKSNGFTDFDSTNLMHFFENDELILIATTKGIFQLDPQKGIVQHFSTKNNTLPNDNIVFIHQDKEDNSFWLGTRLDGLIHWDKTTGQTEVFTKKDGLVDNLIYAIYEDDQGYLWLPSNYGLMQFNKKTHDIVTYTTKDGLPYDEFNYFSHHQDEEGTLYLGGLNGITIFHPKNFTSTLQKNAPLHLTSFEVFDEKNKTMVSRWNDFNQNKKIILQPDDHSFLLSFALLDFKNPEDNQFEYKIDGYDSDWTSLDNNNLRIYDLPHGKYTIVIKGRNSKGEWSNQHLEIPLLILQPFYSKWWFKVLAALSLIGFISFIIRRRTANLLMEKEKLEKEVVHRTKEIKKQAEELKKLDEVKTRFFANVTHELRTPLTLIISPLKQLMKTKNLDDKTMRTLTAIAQNGEQLKNLVEEILDLSRYDANKLEVNKKPVHFLAEVRKWATGFDLEAQHRGIDFQLFYQLAIDAQLIVDDQKLKKIVTNLLSNAFKFTQSGDSITLEVAEKQSNIILKVTDTGQGIHSEDLPHIFQRFFQTKQTDANLHGGLGIGLALSKELANLLEGQLSVQSTYGLGTTFILEFPKEISTTQIDSFAPTTIAKEEPLPSAKKNNFEKNILIVEDNIQMRLFIQDLLHSSANTFLAANGKDALKILAQEDADIHLIVSDVMMPEMDGFTLLEKLKTSEKWQLIPVIMLTALSNTADKLKAITIGVDDYLIKPFEAEELIARVNTLLQNIEQRKNTAKIDENETEKELPLLESADLKWLKNLEEIAFENVTKPNFKVSQLAFEMAISERQFNRRLKKITGLTPGNYLKEIKLQKARQLLENKVYTTIAEVAYSVGFSTPEYFSKIFKNRFGKSPSDYLKI
ncbi:MAG: ATP-binding protein [Saprospiraceae bacterium]